jgi:hypothetical protein
MIAKLTPGAVAAVIVSVLSGVALAQTAPAAAPAAPSAEASRPVDPAVAKFRAVCKADMDTYCGEVIAAAKAAAAANPAAKGQGRGQMATCMATNEAKLSADCKTAWDERKAAMKVKQG